ncbi:MAG: sialidase family protein [Longimicrobiales bacterium]|nr:sialidase family protein [Longimicrobiales bacterium]
MSEPTAAHGRVPHLRMLIAVTMALSALAPSAPAQAPGPIDIGPDRLVSAGIEARPVVEPWLAVHPTDPSRLLATAIVASTTLTPADEGLPDESFCATWLSRDGGESWRRRDHPVAGCADPWVVFTSRGTGLFTAVGTDGVRVLRSPDGGATWSDDGFPVRDVHDHPMLVVDPTDGPFAGHVYFVSGRHGLNAQRHPRNAVYVARSADDGRSFPFVEPVIASNLVYEAQLPVVLSDGTLLVAFSDHRTMDGRALDVGARRSWTLRSTDGGGTFTEPLFITDACDGRGGWPMLAAGPDDRVWFTCVAPGSAGILVFRSDDRGESWRGPVRVDGVGRDAWTRTPTLAVSEDGVLGLAWYDRGAGTEDPCTHVRFTASLDGGESFLPPGRVSTEASCPETRANDWAGARFPAGGDYSGLAATGPRAFRVLWSDARDGVYRLRTASVRVRR